MSRRPGDEHHLVWFSRGDPILRQFHGFALAVALAWEGVVVTWAGMRTRSVPVRTYGAVIPGGGSLTALSLLFDHYRPADLLLSPASASGPRPPSGSAPCCLPAPSCTTASGT